MTVHSVAQGTQSWLDLRKGIPTASRFDGIMTPGRKKSESAEKYMQHLLAERILGRPIEGFKSKYMELGNEYESRAVASYELANDCETEKVGFVTIDDGKIGCSPDRFIVDAPDGMLECKAPSPAVHVSYLLAASGASKEYKVQLQGELWCCERDWVDIISYSPGMPDASFRVYRDEEFILELAAHVRAFSCRLEELAADFTERGWIKAPVEAAVIPDYTASSLSDADLAWVMGRPAEDFGDYTGAVI
jgi:hypothetical protein